MSLLETSTAPVAVDRISNLPDDILIHILSSFPTKQAFVTSILSKRWKHLWCYVPDVELEFVDDKAEEAKNSLFDKFVYSVLVSRSCGMHYWERMIPHLPYSILTCATLVVLKLGFLNGNSFKCGVCTDKTTQVLSRLRTSYVP
ncbi:F-box/RNI/FBD-like domain protein [Medicago truncatula]|uniref:F-box/RNI/FBD-like domain protein n=2 Tax=Medicago truncatula TaxID=3880 RepID=A0A072TZ30_MEDTR|nr:F-box/RNI/FBD-like domain protein [Medicago truncatula]